MAFHSKKKKKKSHTGQQRRGQRGMWDRTEVESLRISPSRSCTAVVADCTMCDVLSVGDH